MMSKPDIITPSTAHMGPDERRAGRARTRDRAQLRARVAELEAECDKLGRVVAAAGAIVDTVQGLPAVEANFGLVLAALSRVLGSDERRLAAEDARNEKAALDGGEWSERKQAEQDAYDDRYRDMLSVEARLDRVERGYQTLRRLRYGTDGEE